MGHEAAREGDRLCVACHPNVRRCRGEELNEMTIGRNDDPENPISVPAFETVKLFGTGPRFPSGPADIVPHQQAEHMPAVDPLVKFLIHALEPKGPSTRARLGGNDGSTWSLLRSPRRPHVGWHGGAGKASNFADGLHPYPERPDRASCPRAPAAFGRFAPDAATLRQLGGRA